jgi:hypothetical protein
LSDTLSLQLDDGRLECLPHPAERAFCERHGLTLLEASARGRLYRETFYVCRHCGREGETIEPKVHREFETVTVREAMTWGWGSAVVLVPLLAWMRWWAAAAVIGGTLLASPGIYWWENRKIAKRDVPRADAPGRSPIPAPTSGLSPESVVGRVVASGPGRPRATGPCCDQPDWVAAFTVTDEDRVPCRACGRGVMVVSEHALH